MCLPPGHRDAEHTDDSLVFDTFKRYLSQREIQRLRQAAIVPRLPQLRFHTAGLFGGLPAEQHGPTAIRLPVQRGRRFSRQRRVTRFGVLFVDDKRLKYKKESGKKAIRTYRQTLPSPATPAVVIASQSKDKMSANQEVTPPQLSASGR